MANISKNKTGTYKIRVYLGEDLNGNKLFKNTTYKPKATTPKAIEKEVQLYAADFERRVKDGSYLSGEEMTFKEFYLIWLTDFAPKQLTKSEVEHYSRNIERIFLPTLGNKKISAINPLHLQQIITDMEKSGLQPATIRRYFNCISSVLNRAFKSNIIKENPCQRLLFPKIENDPNNIKYFDREHAITFLNALKMAYTVHHPEKIRKNGRIIPAYDEVITVPLQFQTYFTLAVFTGARRGEMVALTWNDIDFDKYIISITKGTSATKKDGQYVKDPKSKAGVRSFSVPVNCIDLLKAWKEEQKALCESHGTAWKGYRDNEYDNNFVFIQDNGLQMHLSTPYHKFKEILEYYNNSVTDPEKKLPSISLHDLRHTSASLMIASGIVDIETIARRLGHSDVSMTLNRYGHALPSQDEKAMYALDMMLNQKEPAADPEPVTEALPAEENATNAHSLAA